MQGIYKNLNHFRQFLLLEPEEAEEQHLRIMYIKWEQNQYTTEKDVYVQCKKFIEEMSYILCTREFL